MYWLAKTSARLPQLAGTGYKVVARRPRWRALWTDHHTHPMEFPRNQASENVCEMPWQLLQSTRPIESPNRIQQALEIGMR